MKLARIEHWRCGEPMYYKGHNGSTYVWVPKDMTAEELDALCEEAQKAYLDTEREMKSAAPVAPPGYSGFVTNATPDDMTVGELRAQHEKQTQAYKEYQALVEKSRKPFGWHLHQVSGGEVLQFWGEKPELEVELSWGHNHGTTIDHSPTEIGDYPFPQDEDEL